METINSKRDGGDICTTHRLRGGRGGGEGGRGEGRKEGRKVGGGGHEKIEICGEGGEKEKKTTKEREKDVEMRSGEREGGGLPERCLPGFKRGSAKKKRERNKGGEMMEAKSP